MSRFSRLPGIADDGGWKNYVVGFGYVLLISGLIGIGGGGGGADTAAPEPTTTTATPTETTTAQTTAAPTPEEVLESKARAGLEAGGFSDGVREIDVVEGEEGYVVTVRYDLSSLGNAEDDKFDANDMAIEVLKRVYESDHEVMDVAVFAYVEVQDQYGNESDEVVSKVQMDAETAQKVNWENVLPSNIPEIADDYVFRSGYYSS